VKYTNYGGEQGVRKRFSVIDYAVLKEFDVTPNELAYIDMVYYLSRSGSDWCFKSLQATADDLNLGKSTIKSMRDRLIEKNLLLKNIKGHVKTTEFVHIAYGVRISHDGISNRAKSDSNRAKSEQNRAKSDTKNNNRIHREYGIGYEKFQEAKKKLKMKAIG